MFPRVGKAFWETSEVSIEIRSGGTLTLTIDGSPVHLSPRVAAMIVLLIDRQEEIEALKHGHIELHYNTFRVLYYPPRPPLERKISTDA